jgi:pimeloyl-ACP methyl ester carboxylesterase
MSLPELKRTGAAGLSISYREVGEGPVLFFVHGMGCGSVNWETQYEQFSDRYRVIGWDAPGYGESEPFDTDLPSVADYVMAMAAFLDSLGIEKAHLVGHSYGGIMVTGFHRAYPDKVLSLTLAQPVIGGGVVDPAAREEGIRERFALVEKIGMQKYAEQHVPQSCAPGADAAVLARGIALTAAIPQSGYLRQFRSLRHANIFEWTSRPRIPAMIVSGEYDITAATGMVEQIAKPMRGIRHEQIAGIGHMIYLEYPERFNALLEGLLAEVE